MIGVIRPLLFFLCSLNAAAGIIFRLRDTGITYTLAITQAAYQPALDAGQALSAFYCFRLFIVQCCDGTFVYSQLGLQVSFFHNLNFRYTTFWGKQ